MKNNEKIAPDTQQIISIIDKAFSSLTTVVTVDDSTKDSTRIFFPNGIELISLDITIGSSNNPLASLSFTVAGKDAPNLPNRNTNQLSIESENVNDLSILGVGKGNIPLPKDDVNFIAGIVYGETSTVLAPKSQEKMASSRKLIAEIACRRQDQGYQNFPNGVATSQRPSDSSLEDPNISKRWEACVVGQTEGKKSFDEKKRIGKDTKLRHFFMWPSDDEGKTPRTKVEGDPGNETWPFTEKDKIVQSFGPFTVQKPGSTPAGENIFIFIYDGVA